MVVRARASECLRGFEGFDCGVGSESWGFGGGYGGSSYCAI